VLFADAFAKYQVSPVTNNLAVFTFPYVPAIAADTEAATKDEFMYMYGVIVEPAAVLIEALNSILISFKAVYIPVTLL